MSRHLLFVEPDVLIPLPCSGSGVTSCPNCGVCTCAAERDEWHVMMERTGAFGVWDGPKSCTLHAPGSLHGYRDEYAYNNDFDEGTRPRV